MGEHNYPGKGDVAAAFGAVLLRRRLDRGLTQDQLAEAGGVSSRYVSMMERGRYQPSLHTVVWMARGLGAEPAEIVAEVTAELRGSW